MLEATSALDAESEKLSKMQLLNLQKIEPRIAHRLSTVLNANKIFVMKNGNILNSGTHEELIDKCNEYKSLCKSNLPNVRII